ncbi:MAG: DNA-binding protein [Acidobacteria bacterium RIFCSPLOWO2_12_FULL_54_10]|nr:MAG: DNA-binding protein [Acidobacteria bacterium RIFCSPLOWO2_12_FULL_54_10]
MPIEIIERQIYLVRGQKVMLDADLASLYQVPTKVFNQAVRRNLSRFPQDFMLQLSKEETSSLRSQIVTLEKGRGRHPKYRPLAFTEQGVAMLSSVLHSDRAAQMNILIIRAFIALRNMLATHKDLARKMESIERQQAEHGEQLAAVYSIVKQLINPPDKSKKRIGFALADEEVTK